MGKKKFRKVKVFVNEFHNGRMAMQIYFPPKASLKDIDEYLEMARTIDTKFKEQHPEMTHETTYKLTMIEEKEFQL
ncbi:hypothetical protein [Bacillus phage Anath]|uniref:Uncharacterized protein n=1 Tax=Bacillus phage Anath TaxID=2108114 RepID=A0A2P1JUP5_9CAUD|nr:hypothetical protein [Bacillus phage Anath]